MSYKIKWTSQILVCVILHNIKFCLNLFRSFGDKKTHLKTNGLPCFPPTCVYDIMHFAHKTRKNHCTTATGEIYRKRGRHYTLVSAAAGTYGREGVEVADSLHGIGYGS